MAVQLSSSSANHFSCATITGRPSTEAATVSWDQAPPCMAQARELMIHRTRSYGEFEDCSLDQLNTLAWIKNSGGGKVPMFRGKNGFVIILCLGADVALDVDIVADAPNRDTGTDIGEMILHDDSVHAPLIHFDSKQDAVADETKVNAKPARESMKVTLIHGDILIVANSKNQALRHYDPPKLGRKDRSGKSEPNDELVEQSYNGKTRTETSPDLLEAHILRSLANVKAKSIHTSCVATACIVLDIHGTAYLFGRNERSVLGVTKPEVVSETAPIRLKAADLGAEEGTTFVHAAIGRTHSLLVGSNGQVWSAGKNDLGQTIDFISILKCGHPVCPEVSSFKLIDGLSLDDITEHVIKVAAGVTFSIFLTESGKVFSCGSGEKGQLGRGRTGEHIVSAGKTAFDVESEPVTSGVLVKGLAGKKIVQVSCGQQHTVALDSEGVVYVWGYNGYCRLGLGNQVDILIPKPVPNFAGPNVATMGAFVTAGPSNTVVVDNQGMYWMAGKWKNSGEGSSGSPYSSFRYMQDIMACKIRFAACGGVTHWALTEDEDGGVLTVAWGQNAANGMILPLRWLRARLTRQILGELGLGADQPKSATKPGKNEPLGGIEVIACVPVDVIIPPGAFAYQLCDLRVAPAQNNTFFLAKPSEKLSELERHPEEVDAPSECVVCNVDNGDDADVLQCDKCLDPPLTAVPDGEWFCPACGPEPEDSATSSKKASKKPFGLVGGGEDDDDEAGKPTKRKASVSKPAGKLTSLFAACVADSTDCVSLANKRKK
ncbi:hypothetical protein HWV62_3270 [Athelia sp. TMB]|nr:hypothetical protein HWV62_3270 [Athelia sp. TMB]